MTGYDKTNFISSISFNGRFQSNTGFSNHVVIYPFTFLGFSPRRDLMTSGVIVFSLERLSTKIDMKFDLLSVCFT